MEAFNILGFSAFESMLLDCLFDFEIRDNSFSNILSAFSTRNCMFCGEPCEELPYSNQETVVLPPFESSFAREINALVAVCDPQGEHDQVRPDGAMSGRIPAERLVLLGKMLADLGFPDEKLVEDISTGFKLSGCMPDSNIFPKHARGPTLTLEALQQSTGSFNSKVYKHMQLRQDSVLETDGVRPHTNLNKAGSGKTRAVIGTVKLLHAVSVYGKGRRPVSLMTALYVG